MPTRFVPRGPRPPQREPQISLRPWAAGDLDLLERLMGDPRMTEHLGGAEPPEKLRARHERYVAIGGTGKGAMFVICAGPNAEPVGSIGYWELDWAGETAWETGWSVVPEWQGRGIATSAAVLVLEKATEEGSHRSIHAFPAFENEASNAVCRKAGFTLIGECEVEFPPGRPMRANDWVVAERGSYGAKRRIGAEEE